MVNMPVCNMLLGILGTQEIIILLIFSIPVLVIIKVVRFMKNRDAQNRKIASKSAADEIEKLFALKQKGMISEKEFDDRKSILLK